MLKKSVLYFNWKANVYKCYSNPIVLIEQQLAHVDGTVRGDYNRADSQDAIQQRRVMLQYWADYLDQLRDGAQIIPIRADALSLP